MRATGENPFLKSTTATVQEDGTFRARFDFADVPPATAFRVRVTHDGSFVARGEGNVTG